jgi:hypothetical protein
VFWRVGWQEKQAYVFMPAQERLGLLGLMNAGIIQYDSDLLAWCALVQLGQELQKNFTVRWF